MLPSLISQKLNKSQQRAVVRAWVPLTASSFLPHTFVLSSEVSAPPKTCLQPTLQNCTPGFLTCCLKNARRVDGWNTRHAQFGLQPSKWFCLWVTLPEHVIYKMPDANARCVQHNDRARGLWRLDQKREGRSQNVLVLGGCEWLQVQERYPQDSGACTKHGTVLVSHSVEVWKSWTMFRL